MSIALMVVGGLIALGSFAFAGVNIYREVKIFFSEEGGTLSGIREVFARHILAMMVMVVGGAIFTTGLLILIFQTWG